MKHTCFPLTSIKLIAFPLHMLTHTRITHPRHTVAVGPPLVARLTVVRHKFLPYITCQFVTESSIVAAGYDCSPVVWSHDDNDVLTYINKLDQKKEKTTGHLRYVVLSCHFLCYPGIGW